MLICGLVGFIMLKFSPMYITGLLGIPFLIFFLNNPRFLFKLLMVTFFSGLSLPLLPGGLTLFHFLGVLYLGIVILGYAFRKQARVSPDGFTWSILVFSLVVLLVVFIRGFGFRFLGDDNWGGLRYVELFIMLALVLNAKATILTPLEWKKTILIGLLFTFIPFLSELLFIVSRGIIWHHYYFVNVQIATFGAFVRETAGHELVRLQSANRLGTFLLISSLFFLVHRPKKLFLFSAFYLAALLLIGLSGHRSGFFDLIFFPWIVGLIYFKKNVVQYLTVSTAGLVAVLILIYSVAIFLPLQFQRAVSWLPGIQVANIARDDAEGTLEWRFDVWDAAFLELRQNPDYLLIGKGLTYSSHEYMALEHSGRLYGNYSWAIITSTYHQGVISLLVILGIPGLIAGVLFLGLGLYDNRPSQINDSYDSDLKSVHMLVFAYTSLLVAKFFTIYGDVQVSWPVLCFWFIILDNLRYSSKLFSDEHERLSTKNNP